MYITQQTQDLIDHEITELPPVLSQVLSEFQWQQALVSIARDHAIAEEKFDVIIGETFIVLAGLDDVESYKKTLGTELSIDENNSLFTDIAHKFFERIERYVALKVQEGSIDDASGDANQRSSLVEEKLTKAMGSSSVTSDHSETTAGVHDPYHEPVE